jgi:hypothetical protein
MGKRRQPVPIIAFDSCKPMMGTRCFAHPTNLKPLLLPAFTFHQAHIISLGQVAIAAAGRFLEQQSEELSLGESEQERRGQSEQQHRFSPCPFPPCTLQHQNQ